VLELLILCPKAVLNPNDSDNFDLPKYRRRIYKEVLSWTVVVVLQSDHPTFTRPNQHNTNLPLHKYAHQDQASALRVQELIPVPTPISCCSPYAVTFCVDSTFFVGAHNPAYTNESYLWARPNSIRRSLHVVFAIPSSALLIPSNEGSVIIRALKGAQLFASFWSSSSSPLPGDEWNRMGPDGPPLDHQP